MTVPGAENVALSRRLGRVWNTPPIHALSNVQRRELQRDWVTKTFSALPKWARDAVIAGEKELKNPTWHEVEPFPEKLPA